MIDKTISFVKSLYPGKEFIPLHEPVFLGNEKKYLNDCIDSTFVSSVGKYVDEVEQRFAEFVGSQYAVAVVNGTSALHLSLVLADVQLDDEVITQPLTFVATCNAIRYQHAHPVFVDVSMDNLGLSADSLSNFLKNKTQQRDGRCINTETGRVIKACVPMHTFGHPAEIECIAKLCEEYNIVLIEDAAEGVGSYSNCVHVGNSGSMAAYSFNGNKTITSGGGGIITTNDEHLAKRAKYLSTTAKAPHAYKFYHTELGYNYRMPNINAALLLAQLEQLEQILAKKRDLAAAYNQFFEGVEGLQFVREPSGSTSNYWLNALLLRDKEQRDLFLEQTNAQGVMTRPIWDLMTDLPEFKDCQKESISNSIYLSERIVNIPSGIADLVL